MSKRPGWTPERRQKMKEAWARRRGEPEEDSEAQADKHDRHMLELASTQAARPHPSAFPAHPMERIEASVEIKGERVGVTMIEDLIRERRADLEALERVQHMLERSA